MRVEAGHANSEIEHTDTWVSKCTVRNENACSEGGRSSLYRSVTRFVIISGRLKSSWLEIMRRRKMFGEVLLVASGSGFCTRLKREQSFWASKS